MHVMLDLETLDTKPSAIVLSIGVAQFDEEGVKESRCWYPDVDEQIRMGRTFNASTLFWWMHKQREEAREDILLGQNLPVANVLHDLAAFCTEAEGVWGNGSDFDNAIIRDMAAVYNIDVWPFRRNRCFRTLLALNPDTFTAYRNGHTAMGDAINQARVASELLRRKM